MTRKAKIEIGLITAALLFFLSAWTALTYFREKQAPVESAKAITNYAECAAAGNAILESYPEQCRTADGRTFTRELSEEENSGVGLPLPPPPPLPTLLCVDKCGDGQCEEIVCEAEGCPCAEAADTCPADCQ